MVSLVSIYLYYTHIHMQAGTWALRNFGTPELRLEGFSPGTPVSLLSAFRLVSKKQCPCLGPDLCF